VRAQTLRWEAVLDSKTDLCFQSDLGEDYDARLNEVYQLAHPSRVAAPIGLLLGGGNQFV
jgi:hypothetical protein